MDKFVGQGRQHNDDVSKLGGHDTSAIGATVFVPHNVHVIIAYVSPLLIEASSGHFGSDVIHHLTRGRRVVGSRLANTAVRGHQTKVTFVRLHVHLFGKKHRHQGRIPGNNRSEFSITEKNGTERN